MLTKTVEMCKRGRANEGNQRFIRKAKVNERTEEFCGGQRVLGGP